MPDERTYGFSMDDAQALIQSISHGENIYPEIRPRGTGGGGDYFWFTVDSLVCPGEDPTNFPDGGLIVTATYSPSGQFPRGREDDDTDYV